MLWLGSCAESSAIGILMFARDEMKISDLNIFMRHVQDLVVN